MTILRFAFLTLREMARKRLFLVAAILIGGIVVLSGFGARALANNNVHGHPLAHVQVLAVASQMMTFVTYLFSMILALGGAFVAAPALASEIESGLLLPLLARPIRRSDVLLGKYLGLAIFLTIFAYGCGLLEFGVVDLFTGYWPPHPFIAFGYLSCVAYVMAALAMLLSTRLSTIASGIAVVVFFGFAWVCGIVSDIGTSTHMQLMINVGTVSQLLLPSDAFWRASVYHLEPAVLIASLGGRASLPFAVAAPPPLPMMLWAVGWLAIVLIAACWSFTKRDL